MIKDMITAAENALKERFAEVERIALCNTRKVLEAFWTEGVASRHLVGTNGYGYNDEGREVIDRVFARVFGNEAALVRYNFASGTNVLATVFWSFLRFGDKVIYLNKPYDTVLEVLKNLEVKLIVTGKDELLGLVRSERPKMLVIQKSKGYDFERKGMITKEINEIIGKIKEIDEKVVILVDNCYGEFVEEEEPRGDLVAGSLIKNVGGGIAKTGGYIVGNRGLVEKCAKQLTGVGSDVGATFGANAEILQGLFMAPHVVGQAIKIAILASKVFELDGKVEVSPKALENRGDIVQAIKLGSADKLLKFCEAIQKSSPIDSNVVPVPWAMPGYDDEVVMAAGTFVQGASIELTADSAMRAPFVAYMQGGLTYECGRIAIERVLEELN